MSQLSPREMQVLQYTAEGLTNGQIARRLGLALPSVNDLQRRIFAKLHVGARAAAVDRAWRIGVLGVDR